MHFFIFSSTSSLEYAALARCDQEILAEQTIRRKMKYQAAKELNKATVLAKASGSAECSCTFNTPGLCCALAEKVAMMLSNSAATVTCPIVLFVQVEVPMDDEMTSAPGIMSLQEVSSRQKSGYIKGGKPFHFSPESPPLTHLDARQYCMLAT